MRASDYRYFSVGFLAVAHRGGALLAGNEGRENTVHAFRQAVRLGFRYLETDVHTTADGVLVAFHDTALDRVTDASGTIADLPYREVAQARVGGVDAIPTLDELLETFPEANFNIDIKSAGAVEPLVRTIVAHRAQDRVCVGSFGIARLREFRRTMGPCVATSASRLGIAWSAFGVGARRLIPSVGEALQVPPRALFGERVPIITRGLVSTAHAAGRVVHAWTIDDPQEMHRLIDLGVDGLMSDRIDTLKDVLRQRGLWDGDE